MKNKKHIYQRKSFTKEYREVIAQKTNGRCAYCGEVLPDRYTIDHITPVCIEENHEEENLLAACNNCNSYKGGRTLEEYRAFLCGIKNDMSLKIPGYRFAKKYKLIKEIDKPIVFYFEKINARKRK